MTSLSFEETRPSPGNPIDLVEEIVIANDWAHDRAGDDELIVEIPGRWCDYRLYFLWQEELTALHFSCGFDMKVPKRRRGVRFFASSEYSDARRAERAMAQAKGTTSMPLAAHQVNAEKQSTIAALPTAPHLPASGFASS